MFTRAPSELAGIGKKLMRIHAISAATVVAPPRRLRKRGMAQTIPNAIRIAAQRNRKPQSPNIGDTPCIATDTIAAIPIPTKYLRQLWLIGYGLTVS